MALELHQSTSIDSSHPEHYSRAAEQALSERELTLEELEAFVKETPPRPTSTTIYGNRHNNSEPRALGDIMDESEKMLPPGSPSLRHTRGRLENNIRSSSSGSYSLKNDVTDTLEEGAKPVVVGDTPNVNGQSYAEAVKHDMSDSIDHDIDARSHKNTRNDDRQKESDIDGESFAEVVKHNDATNGANKFDTVERDTQAEQSALHRDHRQQLDDELVAQDHLDKHKPRNEDKSPNATQHHKSVGSSNAKQQLNGDDETYAEVVKHTPRSPLLRPSTPSLPQPAIVADDLEDMARSTIYPSPPSSVTRNDAHESQPNEHTTQPTDVTKPVQGDGERSGSLVYENYESRSGTNLASIALGKEYDMSLAQSERENEDDLHEAVETSSERGPTLVSGRRAGAGWSRSAVRWAPHNVPLQRRLQTLAVLAHSLSIASCVAFFFFLCAIPIFWPVLIPYLVYLLLSPAATDGKLAHRSEWVRRSKFWSLFASYFPARLHRSIELDPKQKYIFGYHPHGIISHGAFAAFATEALGFSSLFPGITNTLLTLDSNFRVPLYRDWALRLGLASVSKESCENLLSHGPNHGEGRAITIVVGGARESLDAKPGTLNLVLAKRKGFVKLAIRTGADLVPVLAFGENDMYEQIDSDTHPWIHKGQLALKKFMGFTVPLFHARGIFNYDVGIMPYRRPINIVVGRPIKTNHEQNPDPAYVDRLHDQYTNELLHIWNDWKDTFAPDRKEELHIIE